MSIEEIAPIERWMAARKARATKSNVRRALFSPMSPEDHVKANAQMDSLKALQLQNAVRIYNFDFARDTPLEGRLQWRRVDTAPMPYTSRLYPGKTQQVVDNCSTCTHGTSSARELSLCDTNNQAVNTTHDEESGVFMSDDENQDTTSTSPSTSTSSPRLNVLATTLTKKRTILDYYKQKKTPRVLGRVPVKRLQ